MSPRSPLWPARAEVLTGSLIKFVQLLKISNPLLRNGLRAHHDGLSVSCIRDGTMADWALYLCAIFFESRGARPRSNGELDALLTSIFN